ncbi:hypothetical protein ACTXT7_002162 [Hymenolepis weldensis]
MPYKTYGRLLTHQITCEVGGVRWGMVEKEVTKHSHNTKSSSLMEAIGRGMEDIKKNYLIKACRRFQARTAWCVKCPQMPYASCL